MSSKFLYTITTGRSGTVYLTKLLELNIHDANVFHERTGYMNFGVHTPDASHFTRFNYEGNSEYIQAFWKQKLLRDKETNNEWYIETSHFLSKAGLIENLDVIKPYVKEIHIVNQSRDVFKTLWSYVNRFDFINTGFTQLFTLDHRYPNVIINSNPFVKYGMFGYALWYIIEMECRAEYYSQLLSEDEIITFHKIGLEEIINKDGIKKFLNDLTKRNVEDIIIPEKTNETKHEFFGSKEKDLCRNLVNNFPFSAKDLASNFIASGQRLEYGKVKKYFISQ